MCDCLFCCSAGVVRAFNTLHPCLLIRASNVFPLIPTSLAHCATVIFLPSNSKITFRLVLLAWVIVVAHTQFVGS